MRKIESDYSQFAESLQKNEYVVVNRKGEWYVPNRFVRFIRRLFVSEKSRISDISTMFTVELDKLNKEKVSLNLDKYKSSIAAAKIVAKSCQSSKVERKALSMEYRLGKSNGGLDHETDHDVTLFSKFERLATDWKTKEFCFKMDEKSLTENDLECLKQLCRYKKYAEFVEREPTVLDQFFKWSLRDKNSVDIFVQFSFIQEKMSQSALSKRVGAVGERVFKMSVDGVTGEKDVTLAFVKDNGKTVEHLSLLDESKEFEFNSNYKETLGNIYKIFALKRKDIFGKLEIFENGIHNWSVDKLGKYKGKTFETINTTDEKWWENIPTYKTLSIMEAQSIYGVHMNGVNWTVSAKSAIEKCLFDFEGNHGFMEVIIPVDGEYRVYPFGKFADHFPKGTIERIIFLFRTVKARIHYIDQNVYYGHRQIWGHHIPLNPNQGKDLMKQISQDIRHEKGSNNKFSFKVNNCSQWVQSTITKAYGKELPNLYKIPFTVIKPQNKLKIFFNLLLRSMNGKTHHPYRLVEQIKSELIPAIALKN